MYIFPSSSVVILLSDALYLKFFVRIVSLPLTVSAVSIAPLSPVTVL